ncbi:MAG: hypothetical protein EOO88_56075 [Pedobacter sp.]|nr:MAG: hypothetical protein EOO88_56075 [Pedobacter sp.]
MSQFLQHLVSRHTTEVPSIQPRIAGRFEALNAISEAETIEKNVVETAGENDLSTQTKGADISVNVKATPIKHKSEKELLKTDSGFERVVANADEELLAPNLKQPARDQVLTETNTDTEFLFAQPGTSILTATEPEALADSAMSLTPNSSLSEEDRRLLTPTRFSKQVTNNSSHIDNHFLLNAQSIVNPAAPLIQPTPCSNTGVERSAERWIDQQRCIRHYTK